MRPRLPTRTILQLRRLRPPSSPRLCTQNTLAAGSRPRVPFLSNPKRRYGARFITTETKNWIKGEFKKAAKYTVVFWTGSALVLILCMGIQQEVLERTFPTPPDWSWRSRAALRGAIWAEGYEEDGQPLVDWINLGDEYRNLLRRLEDPNIDGAGLLQQDEGGILVAGVGKTGYDVSNKSEPWRRGYYRTLMGCAKAAEHLDGWVLDTKQHIGFPDYLVVGPSYPNPRPMSPHWRTTIAPLEEDCVPASPPPEVYYMRILTTNGFTEKQKMDAALAYATWLDYKNIPETALEMYKWALDIANSAQTSSKPVIDIQTGILNTNTEPPSANILDATTALALHHATTSNLALALPILISILRARRKLAEPPTTPLSTLNPDEEQTSISKTLTNNIKSAFTPPTYPPPPSSGTTPPLRTPKERCEEAAIMAYIGEIIYASKPTKTNREDGLAWTREAVDLAEEELRRNQIDEQSKKTCKQCLEVGLGNWTTMVKKLAKEEKEVSVNSGGGGWLGFGKEEVKDTIGRWESEEKVIEERVRRVKEIFSPSGPPGRMQALRRWLPV